MILVELYWGIDMSTYICDRICKNVQHTWFTHLIFQIWRFIYKICLINSIYFKLVCKLELSFLYYSYKIHVCILFLLDVIRNSLNVKNHVCELCKFLQIWSHISTNIAGWFIIWYITWWWPGNHILHKFWLYHLSL